MKQILINISGILYIMVSLFILLLAVASPFTWTSNDFPSFIYWILYTSTLIIMASQSICLEYFDKHVKL